LKPANLLVGSDGILKIVDFGLATEMVPSAGSPAGTFLYLPPEVIRGQPPEARSDLYSLGLSFYHALTGVSPFHATARAELIQEILDGRFPPPDGPPLPGTLGPAVLRLASPD